MDVVLADEVVRGPAPATTPATSRIAATSRAHPSAGVAVTASHTRRSACFESLAGTGTPHSMLRVMARSLSPSRSQPMVKLSRSAASSFFPATPPADGRCTREPPEECRSLKTGGLPQKGSGDRSVRRLTACRSCRTGRARTGVAQLDRAPTYGPAGSACPSRSKGLMESR